MSADDQHPATRVDPTTGRRRTSSRWHGLIWLVIAVAAPAVWIWPRTDAGELELLQQFWYALGLVLAGVGLTVIQEYRGLQHGGRPVTNGPAFVAYVALTLVVTMVSLIWNPPLTPWYVALALLPAIPCVIAGLRILIGPSARGPDQPGTT